MYDTIPVLTDYSVLALMGVIDRGKYERKVG